LSIENRLSDQTAARFGFREFLAAQLGHTGPEYSAQHINISACPIPRGFHWRARDQDKDNSSFFQIAMYETDEYLAQR
jgi:hypothetical protein